MRNFIFLAEAYADAPEEVEDEPTTEIVVEAPDALIMHDLDVLVTRMRSFMESEEANQEYALGIETGMQRAADMLENLLRRYASGDNLE